ncbi:MAG: hypothetical protein EZS28_041659, partial [Streblomastix strix]
MLKDLEGPKFFSQAAYLSHTMNSIPNGIQNLDQLEEVHRSIDGDFDPVRLDTAIDDARKKLQQQLARQFANILSKVELEDEDERIYQARVDLTNLISNRDSSTMGKDVDESLRTTAEAVNISTIHHREFTWNISQDERTLLQKDTAEIISIEPSNRREDLRLPDDIQQIEKTLINAKTKANIALAMGIAAMHQQLDGRAESERIEAWLHSTAEIGNGIGAA